MTAPLRSVAHRFARQAALGWTLRITIGLPRRIAEDRRAELVSDLWEQADAAARAGQPQWRLALSVLMRTLRGMPADLAWRAGVLRTAPRTAPAAVAVAPMPLAAPLFDQTNGALVTDDMATPENDDAARLLAIGVAANAMAGGWGGAF
ncbi:MAG TPA: hypothetical protein VIG76_06715 [Amnibacterium sp.]|jgi:hypothetical protein|uniref:hypothetical protein n=1 Tax=Amnibacterium sp. TaxID=1872496 RepID=UPI002F943FFB